MQVVRANGFDRLEPPPHALPLPLDGQEPSHEHPVYPLVMVEWQDAWFDFDLEDAEDARTDYPVRTVGFLVSDGPMTISLAQEVLPDGEGFRAVTHIPLPIVQRLVYLDQTTGLATA